MEKESKIILYTTPDGKSRVSLMSRDGRVWLNQKQMAELFAVSKPNVSMLIAKILKEKELDDSVVKCYSTTAADWKKYNELAVNRFFAEVQNKLLFAATGHTAAELVVGRSDPSKPNMGLTVWKGGIVRKEDVIVAKNYLSADEVDTLNRITTIFLETAELRVKRKMDLTLTFWQATVDGMLRSNLYEVLSGPGHISHEKAVEVSNERYDAFDERRKQEEARLADEADMAELRRIEEEAKKRG